MIYKEFFCYAKNDFCEKDTCDNCDLTNGKGGEYRDVEPNDLVHVVRCKDCKHGELLFTYDDGTEWYLCRTHSLVDLPSNWFCKDGERKDDDVVRR